MINKNKLLDMSKTKQKIHSDFCIAADNPVKNQQPKPNAFIQKT